LDHEQREAIKSIAEALREPATSVTNYAEFLLAETTGGLGELQRKFLERIKASTRRMSALVEDLFQVADSETVERRRSPSNINLGDSLAAALAQTGDERAARGQRVQVERPEQLPAVKGDPETLERIFNCLLQNAAAATPDAGEVTLQALTQGSGDGQEYVLVQVSDQGGGISAADLPRIFSGLHTDDNPVVPGTGLACVELAEVRQEVEALHGRIWVDSNPGTGSTFSVLLPAAAYPHAGGSAADEKREGRADA
jgi:signal transduction histidine kinase